MDTIGERIKKRRMELGISQEELASMLGYKSRTSITKIETDSRNLTQRKIKQIADALRTTPEYIMGWDVKFLSRTRIEAIMMLAWEEIEAKDLKPGTFNPDDPEDAALYEVFRDLADNYDLSDEENSLLELYREATPEAQKSAFMVLHANKRTEGET